MAEKVDIIDIDVTTLKDLREEVKRLRKELDNCAIGSEEFNKTLEELTQTQDTLKKATKTNSKEIEAAEGSYDALVKKMSELKKAWRATADEMEKSKLGEEIADINTQLKEMDASLGNYQRNVGNYGSAFEGVTMKIDGTTASFERNIETTRGALDSFDLLEGGLRAIGVESEFVESVMSKVDGAMKFTNGLKAVKETAAGLKTMSVASKAAEVSTVGLATAQNGATVAIKGTTAAAHGLKSALIATGIGAIIVALGSLAANWDKVSVALGIAKDKNDDMNDSLSDTNEVLRKTDNALKWRLHDLKESGATEIDILKQTENFYREKLKYVSQEINRTKEQLQLREKAWGASKEELEGYREKIKSLEEQFSTYNEELLDAMSNTEEYNKKVEEAAKNELQRAIELKKKSLEEIAAFRESLNQSGMNDEDRELRQKELIYQNDAKRLKEWLDKKYLSQQDYNALSAQLDEQYNKDRVEIRKKYDGPLLEAIDLEIEKKKEVIDTDAYWKQRQEENARIQQEAIDKELERIATLDQLTMMTDGLAFAMSELSSLEVDGLSSQWSEAFMRVGDTLQSVKFGMEEVEKLKKDGNKTWTAYGQMASQAFSVAASMMSALADQQDETSKDGFEKQKKLQIAGATMSMLQGVISAVSSAFSPNNAWMTIWGQAAAAATMSAMVIASGVAQINQIKKQTFNGGGSGAVASTPSASPSVTAVQAMGGPAVNPVTNVEGASTEGTIQESRVWVSETDITDTQNKVKTVESESTY
jgi:chromosome segregation ATPase